MKILSVRVFAILIVYAALSGPAASRLAIADEGVAKVDPGPAEPAPVPPGVASVGVVQMGPPHPTHDIGYLPEPTVSHVHGSGSVEAVGPQFGLDKRIGSWPGVDNGDTNIHALWPLFFDPHGTVLFADTRAIITDNAEGGVNLGVAYRHYSAALNRIFGLNAYWDYDAGHHNEYQQVGIGFESLGKWVDFRINGYIPYGDQSQILSDTILLNPQFGGNLILLQRQRLVESAFTGFDTEIGGPLPLLGKYGVSGYLGAYYWQSDEDEDTAGVRVRFNTQITEDWSIGVAVSDDRLFDTNVWMNVALTLPDGKPTRWFRQRPVRERLLSRPERQYRVTTRVSERIDDVPAINPVDNLPIQVVHFDASAGPGGDGTFENPFATFDEYDDLAQGTREDFDILLVDSGTYTDGVRLFDNQRLLSTAFQHRFTTTLGAFDLPGFMTGASRPVLMNLDAAAADAVVIAASNNEVRGFVIDGATNDPNVFTNGIVTAPGATVAGFTIRDNIFQNNLNSVLIVNNANLPGEDANGNGILDNGEDFNSNGRLDLAGTAFGIFTDNVLNGNGNESNIGFGLTNTGGATLNLLVQNNTVQNYLGEDLDNNNLLGPGEDSGVMNGELDRGIGIAISSEGLGSTIIGVTTPADPDVEGSVAVVKGILDNTVSGNGTGVILQSDESGTVNMTVDGNTFNDNISIYGGFRAQADDGGDTNLFSFSNNTASGNSNTGVSFLALNAGAISVLQSEDLNNNGMLDNEDRNGNGVLDPTEDLNGNGTLDAGEDLDGDGMLDLAEDANNNGMLDNEDAQIAGALGHGVLDLGFTNNTITGNGGTGVAVLANAGTIEAHIGSVDDTLPDADVVGTTGTPDNVITGNGGGVAFQVQPSEDANGNGVLDPGEDLNNSGELDLGGGIITGSVVNNDLTGNVGDPLTLTADTGDIGVGQITLSTIANNDMSGSGANGIRIETTNNGSVVILDTEDANRNGALDPGEDANGNGRLDTNGIVNNDLSNPTDAGILVESESGVVNLGRVANNSFDRLTSGTDGIRINAMNTALGGTIVQNSFVGDPTANPNTATGISLTARGGSVDVSIGEDDPILTDAATYGNLFNNNVGAAIFADIAGGDVLGMTVLPMTAEFNINRNVIQNTQAVTGNVESNGEGIHIVVAGSMNTITSMDIGNNVVTNNGANGIEYIRRDQVVIDQVTIHNNLIDANGANGLQITAFNSGNDLLEFDVIENAMTNNALFGVALSAQADAKLDVDLIDNTITGNGAGGILSDVTIVNLTFDDPNITGNWLGNTVANNMGSGLELRGGAIVNIGDGTEAGRNLIINNTGDGIQISGIINDVFVDTNTISNNGGAGVDVNMFGFNQARGTFRNNLISSNALDGMEFLSSNTASLVNFTMDSNTISGNGGRGVDILNRGNGTAWLAFDNNIISSNGEEGLYFVNTSSLDQTQDVPSTDPLLADGAVDQDPDALLRIVGNTINDNGQVVTSGNRGGLVMFIGTSRGGNVDAEITDNTFAGNFGDDVFIRSFVSTVDPPAVDGDFPVRDNPVASQDPLARLDIVAWQRNTGDSLDVDFGGAFYNNADQFKSRDVDQDPPGPFQDAGRRRNATRLPSGVTTGRYQALGDGITTVGIPDGFEGAGLSTFRLENTADLTGFANIGFTPFDIFLTGPSPDQLIPQGHFPLGYDPTVDEIRFPFGWDGTTLSPGTVFIP